MRAAIYARYSSDLQRDASIEDQVRLCERLLAAEGWEQTSVYQDRGMSGASALRPGYQALLRDAIAGAFEVVVAESLDRLSRDLEDTASLYKRLSYLGIRLVTCTEGPISELHVGVKGMMGALYLKDLARAGRSAGGNAFGYDVVVERDSNGEPVAGGRSINEGEAATVRRIFRDYAAGRSPRQIARTLNEEGVPGPGGRAWGDTTIRGHATRGTGILRNELYVGRLVWNRQRYVKDPESGKRRSRLNPPEQWIVKEVPELRIVDDALWQAVADRLGRIRASDGVQKTIQSRFWEQRRPRHLLSGLVTCGHCGGRFTTIGRDYLACGTARRQGTCEQRKGIRRAELEGFVIDLLRENLMQPDAVEAFVAAFHAELNRLNATREQRTGAARRELAKAKAESTRIIDAIAAGFRTDDMKERLETLDRQKKALQAEIEAAPAKSPRFHPNLSKLYAEKVAALQASLGAPELRDEATTILRSLIETVVLRRDGEGLEVALSGDLVAMLDLAGDPRRKQAASGEDTACSIKVVAGAGFEPATFRL
ncbi:recombinase family protein [Oceanibacterium hippocampi]|uniref:recombinase family protein n=1 Tax=Oceanibacterium hippocampi TaxID=745714 RepID=UPI000A26BF2A